MAGPAWRRRSWCCATIATAGWPSSRRQGPGRGSAMARQVEMLEVAGREVEITNPGKVFFPAAGYTKIDLVRYYIAVADGAVRGVADRPMALKRFVDGATGDFFFQKR